MKDFAALNENSPLTRATGFLLTRHAFDRNDSICLVFWLKTATGPVKLEILNELAVFFVEQQYAEKAGTVLDNAGIKVAKTAILALKTFAHQPVCGVYFNTMREFYSARDCLKIHHIKCYEDDFRPDDRYLMERFITANIEFVGHSKTKGCYQQVFSAKCKPRKINRTLLPNEHTDVDNNITLSMVSLDIECAMSGALYSIGLYSEHCQTVFMIGQEPLAKTSEPFIVWVRDERQLLTALISWVQHYDPDIFIGWNVVNFDFNLLQKRCDLLGLPFNLGRDGSGLHWRQQKNSEQKFLEIAGRVVLDGIDLLKTATYNFPSFSLDNVANTLLGIGKKVTNVDNRSQEITENFIHNKPALAAYNLEDCRLVWLIFEKTQLLDFAMLRATLTGLPIDRIGGSVAAFTNLYLPKLHRSGYVAPNMGDGASELVSPGGFVMDSIPGLYDNVLVLDFKSLYPSIIRTFNIDPMGLIEGLQAQRQLVDIKNTNFSDSSQQPIKGFDGAYFSRDKHFLPAIIESLWLERDKAKREKNAALSQAIKIIMNSFYGVLGSTGCRFFDPRLSGSITKRSHVVLKTTKSWIESRGFTVITVILIQFLSMLAISSPTSNAMR